MDQNLKVICWNANGLLQHQQELQVILETNNIDICLISETHFTKHTQTKFKNYKIYHTAHPENSAKGGSAVIVKNNIQQYEELKYITEKIQATVVCIKTKHKKINIAAIYCPPKHSIKKEDYSDFF